MFSQYFIAMYVILTELNMGFNFIEITKSCISKTNFSLTNIALENYTNQKTMPTKSNAGGALCKSIKSTYTKFERTLNYTSLIKLNQVIMPNN